MTKHYVPGMCFADFIADERTYDAVFRNIEIIGEAPKSLPLDVTEQIPAIEWRIVAPMPNWLPHAYFGVDNQLVWNVVQFKVPELEQAILGFFAQQNNTAGNDHES